MAVTDFAVKTSEVQIKIKRAILEGIRTGESRESTFRRLKKIITEYSKQIADDYVRNSFETTLAKGAVRLYDTFFMQISQLSQSFGLSVLFLLDLFSGKKEAVETAKRSGKPVAEQVATVFDNMAERGGEPPTSADNYTEFIYPDKIPIEDVHKKVKAAIVELARAETERGDGHNLRNRAEMFVRWQAQQNSIAQMRQAGVRLVWCSTHPDCSVRCAPWQGKLYSLDGTTGTMDGHDFEPLENATNIFYTTKAGRTYKNGLLGFNCRHRLVPYNSHQEPPKMFSEMEMTNRRKLNDTQRRLERYIRAVKTEAWVLQGSDTAESQQLFAEARKLTRKYRAFCRNNKLVALPHRTQVTMEEITIEKAARRGG